MDIVNVEVVCPTCSEAVSVAVDPAMIGQSYVEDCSVCCRPMMLSVHDNNGDIEVAATREND